MLIQTNPRPYPVEPPTAHSISAKPSWAQRAARRTVLRTLQSLAHGRLEVREGADTWVFGEDNQAALSAVVHVRDSGFYARLLFGGTVGAGEAYADGDWDTDDLTMVVRIMLANQSVLQGLDGAAARGFKHLLEKVGHWRRANTRSGSRDNIAAHYDLSNQFFGLWLDSRMMYSSAVYAAPHWSLEQASEHKLRRLCEMLELKATDHLLEIGTGWGGMAIYAAQNYGARVTTTTISAAQYEEAVARVNAAGLEQQVTVLLQDYRDLTGSYDKAVSVEMVEAVGDDFVDGYFAQVESLLTPGGKFVMQAITIADQRYDAALREVDFIKKHIFPGSFIPSVTRLVNAATRTPSLQLSGLDDIGIDYAKTLRAWSERFAGVRDELYELGFDRRFQRLWQFYFSYCEGGFLERAISDVQIVFSNRPSPLQRGNP